MTSEMELSFPEIEAEIIDELGKLIEHGTPYQTVILLLLICLSVDKIIKRLYRFSEVCRMKFESSNSNTSNDL